MLTPGRPRSLLTEHNPLFSIHLLRLPEHISIIWIADLLKIWFLGLRSRLRPVGEISLDASAGETVERGGLLLTGRK
jgi:hypothetical protein